MSRPLTLLAVFAVAGCGYTSESDGSTRASSSDWSEAVDEEPPADTADPAPACDDVSDVSLYISPDDSNSMSSPVQARLAVLDGWSSLGGVPIRTWEFFNYYSFDYPPAAPGQVGLTVELVPAEVDGDFTLQVGVSSEARTNAERAPMNLTFVLDTSGSMGGEPLDRLKDTGRAVASSLRAGDVVSMVTWSTSNSVVLESHLVDGPNDPAVLVAFNGLSASGGTDLAGGLRAGYELAEKNVAPGRINRVFLVSDGGANVGLTDEELIGQKAAGQDGDGIYMVGVGVGSASTYNDQLMDVVTDAGKGASVFIGDPTEALRVFGPEGFVRTLDVAARDVQIRLDLPPGFEIVRFSGEEYSTDPADIEPQHLAPDDAMVFFQTLHTCAPELADGDAELTVAARWLDAITLEEREVVRTATFGELIDAGTVQLYKGAAIYAYAEALDARRDGASPHAPAIVAAWSALELADVEDPGDPDLAEIREVLGRLD